MNPRPNEERRDTPRVDARLPLQFSEQETSQLITTESLNLSRSGVRCRTSEFVSPLAKVALTLILPPFGNLSKASRILRAEGVVVRCDAVGGGEDADEESAGYDVACCFTALDEQARTLLDAFVAWRILRTVRADEDRSARSTPPARASAARGGRGTARSSAGRAAGGAGRRRRSSPAGEPRRGGSAARGRARPEGGGGGRRKAGDGRPAERRERRSDSAPAGSRRGGGGGPTGKSGGEDKKQWGRRPSRKGGRDRPPEPRR